PATRRGTRARATVLWIRAPSLLLDERPRAAIVLERIDLEPALVDVDRLDRRAAIDELLHEIGEGGRAQRVGLVEGRVGPRLGELAVAVGEEARALRGEHRHADELAVRVLRRDRAADLRDLMRRLGADEAIACLLRVFEHDEIGRAAAVARPAVLSPRSI